MSAPICVNCGKPIQWVKTANGRDLALDAEPSPQGNMWTHEGMLRYVPPQQASRYRALFRVHDCSARGA